MAFSDLYFCSVIGMCPFDPYGFSHGQTHISETIGQIFSDPYGLANGSEIVSLKPLDGISSFEVQRNCLDL